MPTYANSVFVNLGRKQLKRVFDSNQYPSGYRIRFFIIGSGGLDSNNIPKLVDANTTRLECEGTAMTNEITFTNGSNIANGDTTGLVVGDYIRPDFVYDSLIDIGYIKWYQITGINLNTITLSKVYTEPTKTGSICKSSKDLYGFIREIVNTDFTYPDDYTAKVRIFLDFNEGNGESGNQTYSECGLYDIENKLITYSNFPQVVKNNLIQLTRYFLLGV